MSTVTADWSAIDNFDTTRLQMLEMQLEARAYAVNQATTQLTIDFTVRTNDWRHSKTMSIKVEAVESSTEEPNTFTVRGEVDGDEVEATFNTKSRIGFIFRV